MDRGKIGSLDTLSSTVLIRRDRPVVCQDGGRMMTISKKKDYFIQPKTVGGACQRVTRGNNGHF